MSRNAFDACEREYNENEAMREHAAYEREQMKKGESMRTVTAKLQAFVSCQGVLSPKELATGDGQRIIKWLSFHDKPLADWTHVGEATITVDLIGEKEIVENAVGELKAKLQKTQADAEVECNRIREQINSLLALEYKP